MQTICPNCQRNLNLSEVQQTKVKAALAALPPGRTLKLGCPHCKKPMELQGDGSLAGQGGGPSPAKSPLDPPRPPDLEWLKKGEYTEREILEDIPQVMILMAEGDKRKLVDEAFSAMGFKTHFPATAAAALEEMRFVSYAGVVLHSRFEGDSLEQSTLHAHLTGLPMRQRRYILYMLIGPEFRTMYDLEALACSANTVINEEELPHLDVILKKAMHDYEIFYAPYMEALKEYGKK